MKPPVLYGNSFRLIRGTSARSIFHLLVSGSPCTEPGHSCAPEDVPAWGIWKGGAFCPQQGPLRHGPSSAAQALGTAVGSCHGRAGALGSVPCRSRRGGTGCFPSVCRLKAPSPEGTSQSDLTSLLIPVSLLSASLRIMQRAPDGQKASKQRFQPKLPQESMLKPKVIS